MTTKTKAPRCSKTDEQRVFSLLRRGWSTVRSVAAKTGYLYTSQRVSEWLAAGIDVRKKWMPVGGGRSVRAYKIVGGK